MDSRTRMQYAKLMWECRLRLESLRDIELGRGHTTYLQTTIEFEALQLRKLLELIAFSSLVSYQDAYRAIRDDIARDWHAARIIKKVKSINPKFYPVPIEGVGTRDWLRLKDGFLTIRQFHILYDQCGDQLHTKNPFARQKSSLAFHRKVPDYRKRIQQLLAWHVVSLANTGEVIQVRVPENHGEPISVDYLVSTRPEG